MSLDKHIFNKTILKMYDIRGIVGDTLNNEDAYYVGKSYGTFLNGLGLKTCIVGRDARATSESYSKEAISGLTSVGVDVVDIGLVPTPIVYFTIHYLKKDSGFIITASHNPPEYNGFKMLTKNDPIWGDDITKIGNISAEGSFLETDRYGKIENIDVKKDYYDFLLKKLKINKNHKNLKICWDAGNAAVASILDEFVKLLPFKSITICNTVDPNFPNHHPNPELPENLKMLSENVIKNSCDFGIAFDGDGDRIGVVDDEGQMIFGDQLLAIFARDFLRENPGEKVMSEVSSSLVLYDDIKKHGGIPVMWKPGHSIQKAKMKSDNIKLAGEASGHIFFGDNHNYDDAMYAAIKLINILSNYEGKLSDIRKTFPITYLIPKINIKCDDIEKYRVPEEIKNRILAQGREVIDVEGIRVNKSDGWWMCRNSSTGPNMTIRCEALTQQGLEDCKNELKEQLGLSGYNINI